MLNISLSKPIYATEFIYCIEIFSLLNRYLYVRSNIDAKYCKKLLNFDSFYHSNVNMRKYLFMILCVIIINLTVERAVRFIVVSV